MILAVCLNPALDVTYELPRLAPGTTNRVTRVRRRAGGKGVNVARVLHAGGVPVRLLGLAGGAAGAALREELAGSGVPATLVPISGQTRTTVTVVTGAEPTVLTEAGPPIEVGEWPRLLDTYRAALADTDAVVLSGSLPPRLPESAYAELIAATPAGVPVLVDAAGAALGHALAAGPALVKPNAVEAAELLGGDPADALAAVEQLLRRGARKAVVSLGADGLVASAGGTPLAVRLATPLAGNPTGAGDALAAALAAGLVAGRPWPQLLAEAVATAAGAVAVPHAGEVDAEVVARARGEVVVTAAVRSSARPA